MNFIVIEWFISFIHFTKVIEWIVCAKHKQRIYNGRDSCRERERDLTQFPVLLELTLSLESSGVHHLSEVTKWKAHITCELSPSASGCFTICGARSKLGPASEGAVISTCDSAFLHKGRHAICLLEALGYFCWLVIIRDTGYTWKQTNKPKHIHIQVGYFVIILIKSATADSLTK